MRKSFIPFYLPCRQATAQERDLLCDFLHRNFADWSKTSNAKPPKGVKPDDPDMELEGAWHEIIDLVEESTLVVFDWQYYQTSSLVPLHESTQEFARVMCVFWKGHPDHAELFTWDDDGTFHRLVSDYVPEKRLQAREWTTEHHWL